MNEIIRIAVQLFIKKVMISYLIICPVKMMKITISFLETLEFTILLLLTVASKLN